MIDVQMVRCPICRAMMPGDQLEAARHFGRHSLVAQYRVMFRRVPFVGAAMLLIDTVIALLIGWSAWQVIGDLVVRLS